MPINNNNNLRIYTNDGKNQLLHTFTYHFRTILHTNISSHKLDAREIGAVGIDTKDDKQKSKVLCAASTNEKRYNLRNRQPTRVQKTATTEPTSRLPNDKKVKTIETKKKLTVASSGSIASRTNSSDGKINPQASNVVGAAPAKIEEKRYNLRNRQSTSRKQQTETVEPISMFLCILCEVSVKSSELTSYFCFSEKRKLKDNSMIQSAKRQKVCDKNKAEESKTNNDEVDNCSNDRKGKRKVDDRNHSKQRTNDAEELNKNSDGNKKEQQSNQIVKMTFQIDDAVWVKIRGFPTWPAKVERFHYGRALMADVYWFNDYRRTKVFGSQLQSFISNFDTYKDTFQNHIGLETAVKEAMYHLMSQKKAKGM